jgi:hypothetical protein
MYLPVITHSRNLDVVYSLISLRLHNVTILAGVVNVINNEGALVQSDQLILHKDYNPDNFFNDIGLVLLSTPLTFSRTYEV